MLDTKFIREHVEEVKENIKNRHAKADVDAFVALDNQRRDILQKVEAMKNERNTVTKEISQLKRNKENADAQIAAMKKLGDDIDVLDKEVKKVEADMRAIQLMIPNMCHPSVPVGNDDSDNPEVRKWGEPTKFDFQPLNHWDVGEKLGILDSERAAKVTGARFYYYIGAGARLERAVYNFMLDQHTEKDGYTEVIPPYIVNRDSMTGTGQLPKFYEDMYKLNVEGEEMYMIPTAEVPLTNYYRGEIIDGAKLPVYFTAMTPCFRAEAGSAGRDTRGLIRQHQFHKVEMVKYVAPETSYDELDKLTNNAEDILKALGDPVVMAATATATAPVVAELARVLPITRTVVDETVRENLRLEDDRDLASRENRLVSIVATGEKTVIYVNSRDQSVALAKTLRKRVPDCATRIAFYNAGLTRADRHRVEEAFRDGSLSCIVSTSAFGEGVNLPDIRHVVLYHMPFGAIEFNQMSGRAGRDGQPAVIHLLYSSRDARINERLLDCYAPERDELVTLYRALQTMWRSNRGKTGDDSFCASDIDIAQMCLAIDARTPVDERSVESGLGIFEELGFCRVSGFDDTRRIAMAENPGRVQLSRSIRYLEGLRSRMEFSAFRSWALDSCASDMLAKVNRPIVPRA